MANYFWQGLSGATSAAMGTANSVFNAYDRLMEDQANAELLNIRAKTQQDINVFLQDLSQRTDYDNFQKELDNFFTEKDNFYQKNAKNNYTAEKAHELMLGMRVDLQDRVQKKIIDGMRAEQLVMHENTMQINDSIYEGQERIDNNQIIIDKEYGSNLISSDEYNAKLKKLQADTVFAYYTQNANPYIDEAINNDKDVLYILNELDEKVKKDNVTFNVTSKIDGVISDETKENAKAKAKQVIEEQYNLRVNELQKNNANELSEGYATVMNTEDDAEKLSLAKEYLMKIANEMKGKQLDPNDRNKYSRMFSEYINTLDKAVKSRDLVTRNYYNNELAAQTASSLFQDNQDAFISHVIDGRLSPEVAKDALYKTMIDEIKRGEVKGVNVQTEEEAKGIISERYIQYVSDFYNKLYDKIFQNPAFSGVKDRLKNITNDMSKNPDKYDNGTARYISNAVIDFMLTKGNVSDEEAIKHVENAINASLINKLQNIQLDITNNKDKDRSNYWKSTLKTIEENDVIYGNQQGDIFYKTEEDKKELEKVNINAKKEIAAALGINANELREANYIKDKTGDEIGIKEFSYNGNKYHIEAIKNKKNKVTDYKIVDQNGNEIQKYNKEEADKNRDKQDKQLDKKNRQAIKKEKENIQDKIKENAEQKAEREENEYTERKDILSNKDLKKPNFLDVSDEKWIDSSADERHYLLFNYVINNKPPKDTKIDKEKWKNATNHERFKMLFN